MVQAGVAYDPTLSVINAFTQGIGGKLHLLNRSLVLQVGPKDLIEATKRFVQKIGIRKRIAEYALGALAEFGIHKRTFTK